MHVVVDTNVLAFGLLSAHGTPARVLDLLVTGDLPTTIASLLSTGKRWPARAWAFISKRWRTC